MHLRSLLCSILLVTGAVAAPSVSKRCVNDANDRSCWGDYDINTNYYDVVPDTGVTREYYFNIVNTTASPDGVERIVLSINGSIPGPTIIADWGDTVVVHVTNSLQNNGSSIHFHGIRQLNTTLDDGVPSVTQCPIAPGDTYTYTWRATQYGSTWYHSHFSMQAWEGVLGGIVINGPATADYDEDLGNLFLMDWTHQTYEIEAIAASRRGPPQLDNGLLNGTNVYGTLGSRFETNFVAGTRYRIRLVNSGADSHFKFTIDNHTMTVISTDLVPIVPYETDVLSIGMGQRYDIIVTANATADNYWMRAIIQQRCSNNANPTNVLGIIRYDSTSTADPVSVANDNAATDDCDDEDLSLIVPYLALDVEAETIEDDFTVSLKGGGNGVLWQMGNTSFVSQWNYPTVLQAYEANDTWTSAQQVYEFPDANTWVYWVVQTTNNVPHPMHLHGHDFWVMAQGTGTYVEGTTALTTTNPPRRDVIMLPGGGFVVIAFITDNPGVWLLHCHIAWHTAEGLAVQVLERESEFAPMLESTRINNTCAGWADYETNDGGPVQEDSGI